MAHHSHPPPSSSPSLPPEQRRCLERCLRRDCDIDPLILRLRVLRRQGQHAFARSLEQELLPLF